MSTNNCSVGDRCQWKDRNTDEVTGGTIESIIPPKMPKPSDWWNSSKYSPTHLEAFVTYANVKWDDNTTDAVDIDDLDPEDSELEREFRTEANAHLSEIINLAEQASKILSKAVDLSEKYGIPFDSPVSFLGQSYFPTSFSSRWSDVSNDLVYSITKASSEYSNEGWEHSDVC